MEQYDAALLGMLQNEGEVSKFLVAICGFLYRRFLPILNFYLTLSMLLCPRALKHIKTDFYVHLTPDGKMGFPPGVNKKILLAAYKKFEDLACANRARMEQTKAAAAQQKQVTNYDVPPPCARIEEVTTTSDLNQDQPCQSNDSSSAPIPLTNQVPAEEQQSNSLDAKDSKPVETGPTSTSALDKAENVSVNADDVEKSEKSSKQKEEKKKTDEDDDEEQKIFQSNSESYNGAVRENYSWSQSITDVDVRIKVPGHVKKGKDVNVVISRKHLKVSYVDVSRSHVTVVDSDLTWEVDKEESIWSLVSGEHIHINLEKKEERWWDALIVSEPKINVRKIDASRPMTDLDDAEQAKIDELMYNERQKQLGLPQSHESKAHEMLRKAWDVDGSPFKGQPFDPSVINVSENSMG